MVENLEEIAAVIMVAQTDVNGRLLAQRREQLLECFIIGYFARQPGGVAVDNHPLRTARGHFRNDLLQILRWKKTSILVFRVRRNVGVRKQREADRLFVRGRIITGEVQFSNQGGARQRPGCRQEKPSAVYGPIKNSGHNSVFRETVTAT